MTESKRSLQETHPRRYDIVFLILGSTVFLVVGLRLPVLTVRKLWEINTFSILSGIANLRQEGYPFLAFVVFFFSIVFPITKLTALLLVWFIRMTDRQRKLILYCLEILGRWSMLDVFVLAVTIVAVKLGALANAKAEDGIYFFGASIFLAMIVTTLLDHLARRPSRKAAP